MVNQKGEFPKTDVINMRVHPSLRRQAKLLPFSYAEIFKVGCDYLSSEIKMLEFQKGELELEIHELQTCLHEKEAKLTAINNRIRVVNPKILDDETLEKLMGDAAYECAKDIFNSNGDKALERFSMGASQKGVKVTAREWGYEPNKFLDMVRCSLEQLCNTKL